MRTLALENPGWMYKLIWVFAGYTGLIISFDVRWLKSKYLYMNLKVRKLTFGNVRPEKIQISPQIRTDWSESSLGTFWIVKDSKVSSLGERRLWSDYADTQGDLSVYQTHMSEGTFSHMMTRITWCLWFSVEPGLYVHSFLIRNLSLRICFIKIHFFLNKEMYEYTIKPRWLEHRCSFTLDNSN